METLNKVTIEHKVDDFPDTSYLGYYTDRSEDGAIHCPSGEFIHDIERRLELREKIEEQIRGIEDEYTDYESVPRYHILTRRLVRVENMANPDENRCFRNKCSYFVPSAGGEMIGTVDWRRYARQDYERMESLNRGQWWHIGVLVTAEIVCDCCNRTHESCDSVWGIDSDCGEYITDTERELVSSLLTQLKKSGVVIPEDYETARR